MTKKSPVSQLHAYLQHRSFIYRSGIGTLSISRLEATACWTMFLDLCGLVQCLLSSPELQRRVLLLILYLYINDVGNGHEMDAFSFRNAVGVA